ncbi:Rrf2 family transcriptional regulator [Aquibacillus koreensis]|uniref:HTH-type transcriptional regulator NsrR n=1 Tax=Aquibacillus koreensis TaxID=279446 RepID=A0A9X4ALQ4_9BACI|nr:Rrf2 family transcriptional regulator [Aquibacillus koreensis]MCT2536974.1 Rrf2 family transcriptional regulator [Aquibacillus koreensis]MDC3422723.1 Rrf2 family transcriptional regulator [Aquibacillus koreensis]
MRLKKYTDYALRVLIFTAAKKDGEMASIKEIADTFFISSEHVRKVVHQLSKLELIKTVRGRNGGIILSKEPSDINIGQVVRWMENDFTMLECFDGDTNQCVITPSCKLKHVIGRALRSFFEVLDEYTLEDVLENKEELQLLMNI